MSSNYSANRKKKKSSSSSRRVESQREQQAKKAAGENKPNLNPNIRFCEKQTDKKEKTVKFKGVVICSDEDHTDKTNLVDKEVGPMVEYLGNNGEEYIKMRFCLEIEVLIPNGDTEPKKIKKRKACIITCLGPKAKREYALADRKAKACYLKTFELDEVEEQNVLDDEEVFYSYLNQEPEEEDLVTLNLTLEEYQVNEYIIYERYLNFYVSKILWRDHSKALEEHMHYIGNDITKPFNSTVDETFQRLAWMLTVTKFMPPPSKKGQAPEDINDWDPTIAKKSDEEIRQIEYRCLPPLYKDKLTDLETDWSDINAMSDERWQYEVHKIERHEKEQRSAQGKLKRTFETSSAEEGEIPEPSGKKKVKFPEKSERQGKPSWQGQAKGCDLCKGVGMPERKYMSHGTAKCSNKKQWELKLSGNAAYQQAAVIHRKKSWQQAAKSEQRRAEKYKTKVKELRREIRLQEKSKQKRKRSVKRNSSDSSSSSSSSSDDSDSHCWWQVASTTTKQEKVKSTVKRERDEENDLQGNFEVKKSKRGHSKKSQRSAWV